MSADPYSQKVRDYFRSPDHAGDVDDGAVGYFADQGIRIRLSARVEDGEIMTMRFRAWGCPHVIAATEAVCRYYEGATWRELGGFSTAQIMHDLAIPIEKTGRILVLEDTVLSLRQAIKDRASNE